MKIMLVGGGHRAAFYLRAARSMPEQIEVVCAYVRKPEKAKHFQDTWNVRAYTDFDEMLHKEKADYAILAVDVSVTPVYLKKLVEHDIPVLCETPPATTVEDLCALYELVKDGARVQVSEQYNLVPLHAARLNIVHSGIIGPITHAQVSVAHDYHGLSLLRNLLGVKFENAKVTAVDLADRLLDGPTRYNTYAPSEERVLNTVQTIAIFDWGDRSGIYDFEGDQYASWVRRQRVLVRGERGEISDEEVHMLLDPQTPIVMPIHRMDTHEYDYIYLHGYTLGDKWIYKNRHLPKLGKDAMHTYYGREWDFESTYNRLTDDEIAVCDVLLNMNRYVKTGESAYSFAEGAQDQYMRIVIDEALRTGNSVMMQTQPWAE